MFEGELEKSLEAFTGFEERHPGRIREISMANELTGWVLAKLGRWEEAIPWFEKNLQLDFSDPNENFYFAGEKWDMKGRSLVWLRSFAYDFEDTVRFDQFNELIESDSSEPPNFKIGIFPHSFYQEIN